LNWGAQNWTRYSRWGLTRVEQKGRRTSLDLLATLLLMHPRIPLKLNCEDKKNGVERATPLGSPAAAAATVLGMGLEVV